MVPQPIQLIFDFNAAIPDVICHALVSAKNINGVSSGGNKMVDIVSKRHDFVDSLLGISEIVSKM